MQHANTYAFALQYAYNGQAPASMPEDLRKDLESFAHGGAAWLARVHPHMATVFNAWLGSSPMHAAAAQAVATYAGSGYIGGAPHQSAALAMLGVLGRPMGLVVTTAIWYLATWGACHGNPCQPAPWYHAAVQGQ